MKLTPGKWYLARNGERWHVDWVGERNANAHAENGDARLYYPNGTWGNTSPSAHPLDLISEYTPPPVEGSYEWAMALPEGTRIRWCSWLAGEYVTRTKDGWKTSRSSLCIPGEISKDEKSGWLPCEPKLRPWKAEEVPLGAWQKRKSEHDHWWVIVDTTFPNTRKDWLANFEHSLDKGATWFPCGMEE